MKDLLIVILLWNSFTFLLMGMDKSKARRKKRRISEATLLGSAFFLGGVGSLTGALVFRHKTRKWKFRIFLPLTALITLLVIGWIVSQF